MTMAALRVVLLLCALVVRSYKFPARFHSRELSLCSQMKETASSESRFFSSLPETSALVLFSPCSYLTSGRSLLSLLPAISPLAVLFSPCSFCTSGRSFSSLSQPLSLQPAPKRLVLFSPCSYCTSDRTPLLHSLYPSLCFLPALVFSSLYKKQTISSAR
jgi:hypothetical protein